MPDDDTTPPGGDDAIARRKAAKAVYSKRWRDKNPDYTNKYRAEHGRKPHRDSSDEAKARRKARQAAWQAEYRKSNPDKVAAAYQRWLERNPDYFAEYCDKNREQRSERNARWARANPDKVLARVHRRLARKRSADGDFTAADMAQIRERQGDRCVVCDCDLCGGGDLDHIVPLSRGGSNWPSNLQWLCAPCNRSKGALTMDEFLQSRRGKRR